MEHLKALLIKANAYRTQYSAVIVLLHFIMQSLVSNLISLISTPITLVRWIVIKCHCIISQ